MLKVNVFWDCINILHNYKVSDIISYSNKQLADKVVVSSCESKMQVKAVASSLVRYFKDENIHYFIEGMEEGNWVLIDSEEMIIHIFRRDVREYYDIDSFLND